MKSIKIKICGIKSLEDGMMAAELGVHGLGFVFAPSERRISPDKAKSIVIKLPPFITTVGVFMDEEFEQVRSISTYTGVDVIQLHGGESPEYCSELGKRIIKCIRIHEDDSTESIIHRMAEYRVSSVLLDSGCGSGNPFSWHLAIGIPYPFILAGGLKPENVRDAVRLCMPIGVDVSSGVETSPGKKDRDKINRFIQEVQ